MQNHTVLQGTDTDRQTDRQTDKDRDTEKDRETARETEIETEMGWRVRNYNDQFAAAGQACKWCRHHWSNRLCRSTVTNRVA